MRGKIERLAWIVAMLAWGVVGGASAAPLPEFESLFDGQDLSGWRVGATNDPASGMEKDSVGGEGHWRVLPDGVLECDGPGPSLTTERPYGNFELRLEWRIAPGGDAGIRLRGYPQVRILDSEDPGKANFGAKRGSGGLWENEGEGKPPSLCADAPVGEWNRMRVVMVGERVTVELNDRVVTDFARPENRFDRSRPLRRRGPIQLRAHAGRTNWRNLRIRELSSEEADRFLEKGYESAGYESIFDGSNLAGWRGATNNYSLADGAMTCMGGKGGEGGTIYFEREFSDFAVDFSFRLPPGGNNGLAIRYPGTGDTAYTGMCELQILDNTAKKYANLDPRQYHGSAYGMVAAERGYLRPVGQWNFQHVEVVGSKIVVELNGTRILNADLSKATKQFDHAPPASKDRKRGFFGFAGHQDPVSFRNVRIREMNRE